MFMRYVNHSTERIASPGGPTALVLVRAAIAFVFVTDGLQKFLYPEVSGAGRFAQIGFPSPDLLAPIVGGVEIACGALILIGLLTRIAALALVIDTAVMLAATKVPIVLGHGFWGFADPAGPLGFWSLVRELRLDLVMLLVCAFLVSVGPGALSIDHRYMRRA
jgi:putative oxidoreductase